mmetsp:Transcript_28363/g.53327  ORF Transcript_28363/g.53327 Transcript_28363/m.53327 type:complete len:302 (+) Transcript_28363:256-1161(+)
MDSLPVEVLRGNLALFLDPQAVVRLSQTSRRLHRDIGLACINQNLVENFEEVGRYHDGDWFHRSFHLPLVACRQRTDNFVHSVTLNCTWRDQGWGNRKGRIFIVGHRRSDTGAIPGICRDGPGEGRIVWQSPVAEHYVQSLRMWFRPRPDEVYYLWYSPGGGGGHDLRLMNVVLHALVFDDEQRSYISTYDSLYRQGVILSPLSKASGRYSCSQPYLHVPRMISGVASELRRQLEDHGTITMEEGDRLQTFLAQFTSTPLNTRSLAALEDITRVQVEDHLLSERNPPYVPHVAFIPGVVWN